MLTRDLLRFRRQGDRLLPTLIDPAGPRFLELAGEMLALFDSALQDGMRRGELAEPLDALVKSTPDLKLAQAFRKLIEDGCTFEPARELDYPAARKALFAAAGPLLNVGLPLEEFRAELAARMDDAGRDFAACDIYGDLPDNEKLTAMKPLSAADLTRRYNLAQVQGLLFFAESLDIEVADPDPAELRRMFKYLKFFRLLAEVRRDVKHPERLLLSVSGPFAIFANSRKYALQLAAFFPAVVLLKRWKLTAKIRWQNKACRVLLDEKSGLTSHYRNFSAYVPEEIALFHKLFREKSEAWKIVGETPFIECGNGEVFFPDLSFQHESGKFTAHLELFHRWHRTELVRRLDFLAGHGAALPLLIGVDRALADDAGYAELEARYPTLAERMFRFRDFPGVDRVTRNLDALRKTLGGRRKRR